MFKNLVKLTAVSVGMAVATPAFATVYTYSLADGSKLTIDTNKGQGSLISGAKATTKTNLVFTSRALKKFTNTFLADASKNFFDLSSLSGTMQGNPLSVKAIKDKSQPRIVFGFDAAKNKNIVLSYWEKSGYSSTWAESWDYSFGVKGTSVPEPENIALLLLGFGGLFLSSRKRKMKDDGTAAICGALQAA